MDQSPSPRERICRFCFETALTLNSPLISPCECRGSQKFIHLICLNKWRNQNPSQNMSQCFVCRKPYTFPLEYQLEKFPELTFSYRPLRYPYVWYSLYHYVSVLTAVSLNSRNQLAMHSDLQNYELLYYFMYFALMYIHFHVIKKRRYVEHWNREYRWICVPFHVFMLYLSYLYPNSYAFMISGLYLPIYWRTHILILKEMNEEDRPI